MSLVPADLLEILRCPESLTEVREADEALVGELNEAIAAGEVKNAGGEAVSEPVQGGLVRADGARLYPIRDGFPVMLVDEAILLGPLGLKPE